MGQELRVCRVAGVIIRGADIATALADQQTGSRDDPCRRIRPQPIGVHREQLGFAAMAIAVFQSERTGVEWQRVELYGARDGAGLEGRLDRQAASHGAFFRLREDVRTSVVAYLIRRLQQLSNTKPTIRIISSSSKQS